MAHKGGRVEIIFFSTTDPSARRAIATTATKVK
jgi:hypothetical protein